MLCWSLPSGGSGRSIIFNGLLSNETAASAKQSGMGASGVRGPTAGPWPDFFARDPDRHPTLIAVCWLGSLRCLALRCPAIRRRAQEGDAMAVSTMALHVDAQRAAT